VGSGDLRGVQQQQIASYAARASHVRVQTELLVQRVNVYLALGGGFEAVPAATPVAAAKE
jgi:outer membrane protein TolC